MGAAKNIFRVFREVRNKRSYYQRVREFSGYVPIEFQVGDFIVKTAKDHYDLFGVLQLRHQVFIEEWQGRKTVHRLDVDDYDFTADHLMIVENKTGEIIGTYRLRSSHFTLDFYCADEFQMDPFLRTPAAKLEMGRACIAAAHRRGPILDLLWRGLAAYATATASRYLFGCSSLRDLTARDYVALVEAMRRDGEWVDNFQIRATPKYHWREADFITNVEPLGAKDKRNLMPPLLRSYLSAGAKVYGQPAIDREFSCIDVLTILDWENLNPKFRSWYVVSGN